VRPLYFGDPERPLFGIYHPPEGQRVRDAGVLICYPAPQEYTSCHWALRKLALALAREGFHVLRFDYFGTGDSAGDTSEATLEQWRADIAAAGQELLDLSGASRLSVVGFRLGAALAAQAALKVRDLVLWEPVIDGCLYLEELRRSHERLFAHCLYPPRIGPPGAMGELSGLVLTPEQERATAAVDLRQPLACAAERVIVVVSAGPAARLELVQQLTRRAGPGGPRWELENVAEVRHDPKEPFLLSSRAQQTIAARLAGRPA
jgi:pimeloyl-ACP methyl ester carboxylesterase